MLLGDGFLTEDSVLALAPDAEAPETFAASPSADAKPAPLRLRIPARQTIFEAGDRADRLFIADSSPVLILRRLPGGGRTILDIVAPRRLFGFSHKPTHDCAAVSVLPTCIETLPLDAMLAEPAGAKRALSAALGQMERLRRLASLRLSATVPERLATFLLMQAEGEGGRRVLVSIRLPLSRADLADHLMTTVESLARAFAAMKRAAVLAERERNVIEVLDLPVLKAIASGAQALDDAFLARRRESAAQRADLARVDDALVWC
jgi:CRP-like cAMP-binding protein